MRKIVLKEKSPAEKPGIFLCVFAAVNCLIVLSPAAGPPPLTMPVPQAASARAECDATANFTSIVNFPRFGQAAGNPG